jgi:hypothetical protein
MLARAHLLMHEMLDQSVGTFLEGLVLGAHHIGGLLIGAAVFG